MGTVDFLGAKEWNSPKFPNTLNYTSLLKELLNIKTMSTINNARNSDVRTLQKALAAEKFRSLLKTDGNRKRILAAEIKHLNQPWLEKTYTIGNSGVNTAHTSLIRPVLKSAKWRHSSATLQPFKLPTTFQLGERLNSDNIKFFSCFIVVTSSRAQKDIKNPRNTMKYDTDRHRKPDDRPTP